MGRYWLAVGTSWPAVAGRRTELMSLVPSRPVDRPPLGGPACCSGSKGGFCSHSRHAGRNLRTCRVSWQSWPTAVVLCLFRKKRQPVARHYSVSCAFTEHGTPLPRPAPPSRSLSPPLEPLDDGTVRV